MSSFYLPRNILHLTRIFLELNLVSSITFRTAVQSLKLIAGSKVSTSHEDAVQ